MRMRGYRNWDFNLVEEILYRKNITRLVDGRREHLLTLMYSLSTIKGRRQNSSVASGNFLQRMTNLNVGW